MAPELARPLWAVVLSLYLLCAGGLPIAANAQSYAQGSASIEMKRKCKDDRPRKSEDYDSALIDAKRNAIWSWTAQKSISFAGLFQSSEQEIMDQIDKYLLNPYIRSRCDSKTFTLSVRSEVNESTLAQLMASKKPQPANPRSRMTAVFVARQQTNVKTFDAKVVQINETEGFSDAEQSADVAGGSMSASGNTSNRTVQTTGGSSERKENQIEWDVFQADGLDAAVNETFASFGYRTVEASQVAGRFPGFDLDAMRAEFGVGNVLKDDTKHAAFNAIAGKIPLLVIATVDVLGADEDPVSGLQRVYVSVKAQVYQDDGLFYETVASVAPTQEQGSGPSESVALTNALVSAAKRASSEIINQLHANEVQ
jgi:hypothetical protein